METKKQQSFTYHDPNSRGTVVGIVQGNELVFGLAMRNYDDQFSRKRGRQIASGRAVKKPVNAISIDGFDDDGIAKAFYSQAPELIKNKQEQIFLRQVVTEGKKRVQSATRLS